jgi:hypothetical protein
MLFLYAKPPPAPPDEELPAPPPPPITKTETEVTPAGTNQLYEPAVVYDCELAAILVVILLDAALDGPVPPGVAPLTVNVYEVLAVKPLTVIGDVPVPLKLPGEDVAV